MKYTIYAEKMLLNDEWQKDVIVHICNGRIEDMIIGQRMDADYHVAYLTPGIIDNHIHGGNLFHIHEASVASMEEWLVHLTKAGVAAVMSTAYGSYEQIRHGLAITKAVMERQLEGKCGGALLLGAHLEGPFFNVTRKGAIDETTILNPSITEYNLLVQGYEDIVKEMSIAPEIEGAEELIQYLLKQNVKVLAGHTDCTYDKALQAFSWGVGGICHTFNGARPIHHREPGIVAAALSSPEVYCEMIGDLEHLHPGTIRFMMHCKGNKKLMLISDAVKTTNCPDGIYENGSELVEVRKGVSRDKEMGCLCGGGCYSAKSVKKLVEIDIDFKDAVMAATANPARWLGLDCMPETGRRAFLEGWSDNYEPEKVFLGDNIYECTT